MTVTVIGVDPGLVCGVFAVQLRPQVLPGVEFTGHTFEASAVSWLECCRIVDNVMPNADDRHQVVLAVERFTIGGRRGAQTAQPEALMAIGALSWIAHVARERCHGGVRLLIQGAADAGRAASRETLERVGWWTKGDRDQHRNKAAAQVALALLTLFPDEWHSLLDRGSVDT